MEQRIQEEIIRWRGSNSSYEGDPFYVLYKFKEVRENNTQHTDYYSHLLPYPLDTIQVARVRNSGLINRKSCFNAFDGLLNF